MSSDQTKTNFLAAGITNALPQKTGAPPPPPVVKRPRERNVEEEQTSENANLQKSNDEKIVAEPSNPMPMGQEREPVATPAAMMTDEQVRYLAQMLSSSNASTQSSKKAKRQKIDLAELLIQTIATYEGSENIKKQFSKLASSQKSKINQGVFAPEALFTIYNSATAQMKLSGKKVTMSDLMTRALIAYVPDIMKELEEI